MNCQFSLSKDNKKICSYNNKSLHSTYNPEREAERFVSQIVCDFEPSFVVFTGPCIPYSVHFLKARFSHAQIISVQYTEDFFEYENSFDKNITVLENSAETEISEKLFNLIGEENIYSTLFISWPPSEVAFTNQYKITWNAIKKTIQKCTAILNTRAYFNVRWLKNTLKFFKFSKLFCSINKTDLPVIITASGPSLKKVLTFIKQNQQNAIIVALSSSLTVLLENSIIPDFVMTTDGGFWAKEHLKSLSKIEKKIPVILPPEANVPFWLLKNFPIVPLDYGDDLASIIFNKIIFKKDFTVLQAKRNGTVSGTAVELWQNLTSNNIYFAGLDLAPSKGFSHTEPNELSKNCNSDYLLSSTENRITPSTFASDSLLIYRNWFETRNKDFYKKVFRLVSKSDNLKPITNLTDLDIEQVNLKNQTKKSLIKKITQSEKNNYSKIQELLENEREKIVNSKYNNLSDNDIFWFKSCALIEYLQFVKANDTQKEKFFAKVQEKTLTVLSRLRRHCEEVRRTDVAI